MQYITTVIMIVVAVILTFIIEEIFNPKKVEEKEELIDNTLLKPLPTWIQVLFVVVMFIIMFIFWSRSY